MAKGTIVVNNNTKNHAAALSAFGYVVGSPTTVKILVKGVEKTRTFFEVEASEFVDELDLSGDLEAQRAVIRSLICEGKLLTYGSVLLTSEGPRKGFMGATAATSFMKKLGISLQAGDLSCLIAQPSQPSQGESKKAPPTAVDPSWLGLRQPAE